MTLFQIIMLGMSAFFAFKIYEHINTLEDIDKEENHSTFDLELLSEEVDKEIQKGDFQKALAICSEINIKNRNNPEVLFKMGYILSQQERFDEALEYYEEALKFDKDNKYLHQAMASLYRIIKDYSKAKDHLELSLALDPNSAITYYNYGNLLVDMNNYEDAKEMYKKALRLDASLIQARKELEVLENEK